MPPKTRSQTLKTKLTEESQSSALPLKKKIYVEGKTTVRKGVVVHGPRNSFVGEFDLTGSENDVDVYDRGTDLDSDCSVSTVAISTFGEERQREAIEGLISWCSKHRLDKRAKNVSYTSWLKATGSHSRWLCTSDRFELRSSPIDHQAFLKKILKEESKRLQKKITKSSSSSSSSSK